MTGDKSGIGGVPDLSLRSGEITGFEVHAKDSAHVGLPGGWGFYSFDGGKGPAKGMPRTVGCYSCHDEHAAVDTTFVQFYPTLEAAAKAHGTFSKAYLRETADAAK